jgi:2-phosphoglycerate kinase
MNGNAAFPDGVFPKLTSIDILRRRYSTILEFIYGRKAHRGNAFVVLIGGGAAVGKSTLAWQIASVLGIRTVIATDVVRQVIRHERPHDEALQAETWAVCKGGKEDDPDGVYRGLVAQSARLWPVLSAVCGYFLAKGMPTIIEGIHVLPTAELIELASMPRHIVFFVDAKEDSLLLNYRYRAVSTHMRSPDEGFDAISRRICLHHEIIGRARAAGLPVFSAENWSRLTDSAIVLIGEGIGVR